MANATKLRALTLIALTLVFLVPAVMAQGGRFNDVIFQQPGVPAGGAFIRVCTLAATGTPCSPTASIYNDVGLTAPAANPATADINGNFGFWAAPGNYQLQVSRGAASYSYNVTIGWAGVGTAGSAGQQLVINPGATATIAQTKPLLDTRDSSAGTIAGQIDSQCAAAGNGGIIIPGTVGAGNSTVGIPDGCAVADYRGLTAPNWDGDEGQAFRSGFLFRKRQTAAYDGSYSPTNVMMYYEPFSGGQNNLITGKTNYVNLFLTSASRTEGQDTALNINHQHFSNGDTFGVGAFAKSWGGMDAGGDEGTVGVSGLAYQGDAEFWGTVSAINSTKISFTNLFNSYTRGTGRPILNTTAGKFYSTGTVTGISGAVVTFAGSTISGFCSGAQSNTVWFVLDSEVRDGMKYAVPVASCDSNTQVTLVASYSALTATGTYKLYKGSLMTVAADDTAGGNISSGTFHVDSAASFIVGDTFAQPVDYRFNAIGVKAVVWQRTGLPNTVVGMQVVNTGTLPGVIGYELTGPWQSGFSMPPNVTITGAGMSSGYSGSAPQWYVSDINDNQNKILFAVNRNSGTGIANFSFDRATDNWTFGSGATVNAATGAIAGTSYKAVTLLSTSTAPTVSSGFGTSASIVSNNGTAAFTVNVGTGGTASAGILGLPTAATGWNCFTTNITATAANRADQHTVQTASATNSATIQNQTVSTGAALAWTASDIIRVSCFAY